ncbi:MAG TPA: aldo/keto reductase [Candidatus Sulfopaludibacter sp.]|nr:aldo/keto reductase [Candidatus Sulfopaludibacter sp.]
MRTTEIPAFDGAMRLPRVSVLGLGCAAMLGRTGRRESLAALGAAYDAGITFYDTARSYGYGAGEGLLGDFFAGKKRESVVLCTKFGILAADGKGWKQRVKPLARGAIKLFPGLRALARRQAGDQFARGQFSVEMLKRSFETSLRELKTDYVDLLLMHAAPLSVLAQEDLLEQMARLVESGKARLAGISGDEEVMGAVFAQRPPVLRTAQFALNIFNLGLTRLTARAAEEMFLVANHPFGGLEGVSRSRAAIAQLRESAELPATLREKLDPGDERVLPELVLNSILSGTGVSVAIPAMMQRKHLKSNIEAVERCRFSAEELAIIRRAALAAE